MVGMSSLNKLTSSSTAFSTVTSTVMLTVFENLSLMTIVKLPDSAVLGAVPLISQVPLSMFNQEGMSTVDVMLTSSGPAGFPSTLMLSRRPLYSIAIPIVTLSGIVAVSVVMECF